MITPKDSVVTPTDDTVITPTDDTAVTPIAGSGYLGASSDGASSATA